MAFTCCRPTASSAARARSSCASGAGGADVGRLVAREFAWLTGIGALAGLPLAWLAIDRYLAGFVERAPMGGWPMLSALGCVALVALAATARRTLAAVRMSPALALRD